MKSFTKRAFSVAAVGVGIMIGALATAAPASASSCVRVEAQSMTYFQYPTGGATIYPGTVGYDKKLWIDGRYSGRYYVHTNIGGNWYWGWVSDDPRWTRPVAC